MFFNWALITAQEVAFGTSIGKKTLRTFARRKRDGHLRSRAVFHSELSFPGYRRALGRASIPARRGFHDLISGIQPEEI